MMGLTFVQFSYVSLETRRLLFSPITSMVESGLTLPQSEAITASALMFVLIMGWI